MPTLNKLVAATATLVALSFVVEAVRSTPAPATVPIACAVSKNNDGCQTTVRCPQGTMVHGVRAGCNLEWGSVTDQQLSNIADDVISVLKPSDHVEEGSCWVGTTTLSEGQTVVSDLADQKVVNVGCQEHDQNGGDCQIRGFLRCE
jgi:hypothetical protein